MSHPAQLRTYTVRKGLMDEWVDRWRREIVPLRSKLNFEVGGAWIDRERDLFIWLLIYTGPGTLTEGNARYWASPERAAMGLDPEDYLLRTDDRDVETVGTAL
ncbi:NIPSNAP family protein [Streptomyces sp. ST2-7A]|uniref:NIPSNAP family protein n=1 Tax=Streptomyces sp. ST2-7A TaxID=2907214 RepID=UPI001F16493D|nr:NIPSNAP family protein [Streptomyces sp. ST2-7A]MCE7082841.1 NIPSNAP family protein [Streptomyces sp. ST2-7A]